MTIQTHISQDSFAHTFSQFSHALHLPVDEVDSWPDLRNRDATEAELADLRLKMALMFKLVQDFDERLAREEALRRSALPQLEGVDQPPYIPGGLISLIYIPLRLAERMLAECRDDEMAVANLRVAEPLVRLLCTWHGEAWEQFIDKLFEQAESSEAVAPVRSGSNSKEVRFTLLEPPEQLS
jgi:hypothetical protein